MQNKTKHFSQQLRVLYRDRQDPSTGQWYSTAHRIARQTPKYFFVERNPLNHPAPALPLGDLPKTWRIERRMLEQEGYAYLPLWEVGDPLIFTTPYAARATKFNNRDADCFSILGICFPCTRNEVKAAYRKQALIHHPDRGGDPKSFLILQSAYNQALSQCVELEDES